MKLPNIRIPPDLVPDGQDFHIYPGLALVAWGLWSSPVPWLCGVVVGFVLLYIGVFRLSKRG